MRWLRDSFSCKTNDELVRNLREKRHLLSLDDLDKVTLQTIFGRNSLDSAEHEELRVSKVEVLGASEAIPSS